MAIALVSGSVHTGTGANASSAAATFTSNTAGNLLIAVIGWNNSGRSFTSVTDTNTNTWTGVGTLVSSSTALTRIFFAANCKASAGNNTVTLAIGGGANCSITIAEYSGVATSSPLDVTNQLTGTSANAALTTGITTTVAGDLVISALELVSTTAPTAGTGFTRESAVLHTTNTQGMEDQIAGSTGTFTGAWTSSAVQWALQVAAFKAAAGGGGPTVGSLLSMTGCGI